MSEFTAEGIAALRQERQGWWRAFDVLLEALTEIERLQAERDALRQRVEELEAAVEEGEVWLDDLIRLAKYVASQNGMGELRLDKHEQVLQRLAEVMEKP